MKKIEVTNKLIVYLKQQRIGKGDKLPPERELSILLNTSRTTIREVVRMLEERGILSVKRGSGIYLARSLDVIESLNKMESLDEDTRIKDQLEALLLISPIITGYAAVRAEEGEIAELQNCIVKMSRAIVAKELDALAEADSEFHRILAVMTKNYKLISIMERLNAGNRMFWDYFIKNDEFVNNVIFAGYVAVVNAVKQRDSQKATAKAKKNIHNVCRRLSEIKDNDFCAQIMEYDQNKTNH